GGPQPADDFADHVTHVARLMRRCGIEPGVVAGEVFEIRDAGLDGPVTLTKHGTESVGLGRGGLAEMPEHVADGCEAVLDVVIYLTREVAHGDASLRLGQLGGSGAESPGHRAEQPW